MNRLMEGCEHGKAIVRLKEGRLSICGDFKTMPGCQALLLCEFQVGKLCLYLETQGAFVVILLTGVSDLLTVIF